MSLIDELSQRKLVQWALAYVAAAFALLQGIDIVAARFGWPDSVERLLIIALCVGFFVAVLLAWYHGERGAQKVSGPELLLLALLLAIGGGLLWKFAGNAPGSAAPGPVAAPAATSAPRTTPGAATPVVADSKSIAVLPFENLSGDKDNEYFANGMQDMVLTKLAAIGDLKVISRTSTEKYASHPDDLKTIAQQLGVASILEGSVQKSGNSVLINVQLIDAASDHHLWAEAYQRTLDNIFGVEGEVAQKVADALKAKLTASESASVASVPTQNPAAYDAFLRGEYQRVQAGLSWQESNFRAADKEFRRAIELDPGFALAYAALAESRLAHHWFVSALSDQEMAAVKVLIDRALELAPDLPEAHLALGMYYYWGFRRYDDATREFERTLKLSPNNAQAAAGSGFVARRTGRVAQAAAYFEKALILSPRDVQLNSALGETYSMLRRYADGDRVLRRTLAIAPTDANSLDELLITRLFGFGDVAGARQAYRPLPGWRISAQMRWAGDVLYLVNPRAYANFFDRRFADALHDWDDAPTDTEEERRTAQMARIVIRMVAGEGASMRPECAQLEPQLEAELAKHPDSLGALQRLAWVEVCLRHNDRAIAAARKAVNLLPVSKDGYFGAYELAGLAQVAAHAGAPDEALKAIRQLLDLQVGTVMSVKRLELDPIWDPLRKDPRFEALLKEGGHG
jgi:TolB-like protein/Tfp pilus assembly protein PilF